MGINGKRATISARGEFVDFDLMMIKAQLEKAPQNIEVARRQKFIDDKEQGKSTRKKVESVGQELAPPSEGNLVVDDFENSNPVVDVVPQGKLEAPVPVIERPVKK